MSIDETSTPVDRSYERRRMAQYLAMVLDEDLEIPIRVRALNIQRSITAKTGIEPEDAIGLVEVDP